MNLLFIPNTVVEVTVNVRIGFRLGIYFGINNTEIEPRIHLSMTSLPLCLNKHARPQASWEIEIGSTRKFYSFEKSSMEP